MADGNWYYARGNEQVGPVGTDVLRQKIASGEVKSGDLVWRDGMANWQPANSVPELAAAAPAQPFQQPFQQQPSFQQPAYQQPPYQQPGYQQPNYQQPGYQQPGYQQPQYAQPGQPGGQPLGYGGYAPPGVGYAGVSYAKAAQTAMVYSILGLVCCGILGIVGLVQGNTAKRNMQTSGNFDGQGMATAAIIMGWISIAFMVLGGILGVMNAALSH